MRGGEMAKPSPAEQPLIAFQVDQTALTNPRNQQRFERGEELGRGAFGVAHTYTGDNETVVVKEPLNGASLQAEAQAHAQAQMGGSDHIVRLLGTAQGPGAGLKLVLQHAPNGDAMKLQQRLLAKEDLDKTAMSRTVMTMFADMVKGVADAHAGGIMHLDLKLENFFVDENGKLLLGDFGTSPKTLLEFMRSPVDSPDFSAPELVNNIKKEGLITYKADIWSLGVILYQLNSPRLGKTNDPRLLRPFPYEGNFSYMAADLINEFIKKNEGGRWDQLGLKREDNNPLHPLIIQMLDPDPSKRPSLNTVLAHPSIAPYANPRDLNEEAIVRDARQLILEPRGQQLLNA